MRVHILKYINVCKITLSWVITLLRSTSVVWGMPFSVGIELTNNCNLKCPECSSGSGMMSRPRGFMSEELFYSIVSQLSSYLVTTMFYFQGESMLHPQFFEFLEKARGMGVIISTNGHFIDNDNAGKLAKSGAKKIIISLDGFTHEAYSRYRVGGNIESVKSGIMNLARAVKGVHKPPNIILQVLVNRYNENEAGEIKEFARSLNVRVKMKSMQIEGMSDESGFLPLSTKYRRYRINQGALSLKGRLKNRCFRLWTNPVITWDGRIVPCCFDKNAEYEMGNLKDDSFREILNSEHYIRFRNKLITKREEIPICLNCTSGVRGH